MKKALTKGEFECEGCFYKEKERYESPCNQCNGMQDKFISASEPATIKEISEIKEDIKIIKNRIEVLLKK